MATTLFAALEIATRAGHRRGEAAAPSAARSSSPRPSGDMISRYRALSARWPPVAASSVATRFTEGDPTAIDRYLDPGFVNHDPPFPGAPDGPEGMRKASEMFRTAFPDWRSDMQQLIAEGDLVAESFIAHGTHHASLMGETPSGRQVVLRGINIFRIAHGKIVERWGQLDQLGLLQQLGLAPPAAVTGS